MDEKTELEADPAVVWRVRFQIQRDEVEAPEDAGPRLGMNTWLSPQSVNVMGEDDGLEVAHRLKAFVMAQRSLDDETGSELRVTRFRLLTIRAVSIINLK